MNPLHMLQDEIVSLTSRWQLRKCYEVCCLWEPSYHHKDYLIFTGGWQACYEILGDVGPWSPWDGQQK